MRLRSRPGKSPQFVDVLPDLLVTRMPFPEHVGEFAGVHCERRQRLADAPRDGDDAEAEAETAALISSFESRANDAMQAGSLRLQSADSVPVRFRRDEPPQDTRRNR